MHDWRTALSDPVFLVFFWICVTLLGGGGGVLLILRGATSRNLTHAFASFKGWMCMVPLFLGAVFFGRVSTIAFFGLVAMLGFKEFAKSTGLYRDWGMTGAVYLAIIGVTTATLVDDPASGGHGWLGLFLALPAFSICAIFFVPILRNRCKGQLQSMALAVVGFIYVGWMFGHLGFLANASDVDGVSRAYGYIMYLVLAVEVNDIAAYATGKFFGHRKLRSNISPNKTLGGALGAITISMILPFCCQFAFPHFDTGELLLTGVIVGVGGQLGDLSISVIKRDLDIKDMGALIPGHGGVLDRVDSLIFVCPIFFHMVHYFHGIYPEST